MDDIALYLAENKSYFKRASALTVNEGLTAESLVLAVVVLSSSETQIVIGHLGREFNVHREDVLGITDGPENTFKLFRR